MHRKRRTATSGCGRFWSNSEQIPKRRGKLKLNQLTSHEAHQLLWKREISALELAEAVLGRIAHVEEQIHAFVTVTEELALMQAREADERIRAGDASPLVGIPAMIKDNICTKGITTTCSKDAPELRPSLRCHSDAKAEPRASGDSGQGEHG